jgi:hypothetical protein
LAAGNSYRVAAAYDPIAGQIRAKVQGLAAPAPLTTLPKTVAMTPDRLVLGSNDGVNSFLGGGLCLAGLVDRAWTAAEIAAFTG